MEDRFHDADTLKLLLFNYNCLEKALLWLNPEPTWPSGLHHSVALSRQLMKEWLCGESEKRSCDRASTFLGEQGWGDFGWLKHHMEYGDFVHVFYESLKLSQNLSERNAQQPEAVLCAGKSKQNLLFSVSKFFETIDSKLYEYEHQYFNEIDRLLRHEDLWCKGIFENGPLLNWDCVTY